jgi:hypothetical protein
VFCTLFLRDSRRIYVLAASCSIEISSIYEKEQAEFCYLRIGIASSAHRRKTMRILVRSIGVPVLFTWILSIRLH